MSNNLLVDKFIFFKSFVLNLFVSVQDTIRASRLAQEFTPFILSRQQLF